MKTIQLLRLPLFLICVLTVVSWTGVNEYNDNKPTLEVCPKCLEANCIYQQIEKLSLVTGNVDMAVLLVCEMRGIKDLGAIELLKNEYYVR